MKLFFLVCMIISLLAGITFFTVTEDAVLLFAPAIINFAGFGIIGIAYKVLVGNTKEEYDCYRSAHSL